METANRLGWWRQFKTGVATGIPFLQIPASLISAGIEDAADELARGDEEQFAQMENSLGRLFPFVRPSPTFQARLKQALLSEHRQRLAYRAAVPVAQESGISWRWSLAATVPLVIGVLATILWRRSQRSAGQLVSPVGGQ